MHKNSTITATTFDDANIVLQVALAEGASYTDALDAVQCQFGKAVADAFADDLDNLAVMGGGAQRAAADRRRRQVRAYRRKQ